MTADYHDPEHEERTIGENAIVDVRELAVFSHADVIVLLMTTLDGVEHCMELEIPDVARLISSLDSASRSASEFEYPKEDLN